VTSLVALDGAIDRRTRDSEEVAELGGAVFAGSVQRDEVRLLARVELGLFAAQAALGLRDPHALAGPQPDEVGFELGDHRKQRWAPSQSSIGCRALDRRSVRQRPEGVSGVRRRRTQFKVDLTFCGASSSLTKTVPER